ncbi:MAG: hypothetical protein Kow0025_20630 [Thermodesulfovibrionales bacterium]
MSKKRAAGSKTSKKKKVARGFSRERLRQVAWEVGRWYPSSLSTDFAALAVVAPRLGNVQWNVRAEGAPRGSSVVVRVHDVTDVIFDGSNSHSSFDIGVGSLSGNYYFRVGQTARNYLAEVGLREADGSFRPLVRSNAAFFDRDRPSGNYHAGGLFVAPGAARKFEVENVFDAPVYERFVSEVSGRPEEIWAAVVFLRVAGSEPLALFVRDVAARFEKLGARARVFEQEVRDAKEGAGLLAGVDEAAAQAATRVLEAHRETPFHLVHCHDWYSAGAGLAAGRAAGLPVVVTLHSVEHERFHGAGMDALSREICEREKAAALSADLVIVPHSSTRQVVTGLYGAPSEKVVVVPEAASGGRRPGPPGPAEARRWFGLRPEAPLVLFGGEISHMAGADILVEALPTVCRNHPEAQFVFAGDGPLRGELEARVWQMGLGHRCRFTGDLSREAFEALLMASDFVVIPARSWQDEGLAQMAIACGKPVLTTRQAGIGCVAHGENGLVTFDNPGSIVWGIQELLRNPLHGTMLRVAARRRAAEGPSAESVAVQHYLCYRAALRGAREASGA